MTFVVAGLVVALFFALLTLERVGLFGVLKAVGASSRTLAAGLALQAVLIALGAVRRGRESCSPWPRSASPSAVPLELTLGRAVVTVAVGSWSPR